MTEKQGRLRLYSCRSEHLHEKFAKLKAGDSFRDFVGPLGCPSELCEEANLEETKKEEDSVRRRRSWYSSGLPADEMAA